MEKTTPNQSPATLKQARAVAAELDEQLGSYPWWRGAGIRHSDDYGFFVELRKAQGAKMVSYTISDPVVKVIEVTERGIAKVLII